MLEVFTANGTSLHRLNSLAEWVREHVAKARYGQFDVIRFVEVDLPHFFPGLYVEIEDDAAMGRRKAYVSSEPLSIVVSETVYNAAAEGSLEAAETILHEVGHLFMHREYSALGLNDAYGEYVEQIKDTNPANSVEWQARTFAFCLIFPYSTIKGYKNRLELQVYLDLSPATTNRVVEHLRKLRLREPEHCKKNEKRWIAAIVQNLPQISGEEPIPSPAQLELFFKKPAESATY